MISSNLTKHALLAGVLATAATLGFAQDQPAAPAKPATTKPATTKAATTNAANATESKSAAPLTTEKDKVSYAIGADIGKRLRADKLDVDPAIVSRGLKDGFGGESLAMTDQQIRETFTELQTEMQAKQAQEAKAITEKNEKDGAAFLAANKNKEGVVVLPSGLQYKVLKAGDGKKPNANDTVKCNYRGTLIDGTEFDSSYKRGEAAEFPVSGVIKGWTEALQLMPVGSKWQLFIPPDLAYGARGAGGQIGPNSTLVFEVELLSIKDQNADKAGDADKAGSDVAKPADAGKPGDAAKPADAPPNKK
jgi:FKBP-type peptidyl-prolyl cis-trans isomerase